MSQEPMDFDMPQENPNQMLNTPQQPMGQEPMPDDGMNDMDNDGGEADDPKKDIQRQTGTLSQDLRMYNDELDEPDTELNKYVAGMIIPQATKGMTDKEKKEIIKKIKNGSMNSAENDGMTGDEEGDNIEAPSDERQMESKNINLDSIINEIIGSEIDKKRPKTERKVKYQKKRSNPFVSNR